MPSIRRIIRLASGRGVWIALAIAAGWACPVPAEASDRFFVLVFGSEATPKRAKTCHTWATFVRVIRDDFAPASPPRVFVHTISWYPASLRVRTFAAHAEAGALLDLGQTLDLAMSEGESVTAWGPFEITAVAYNKSVKVWSDLSTGRSRYRAIDGLVEPSVLDCIHAVAAVDPQFGRAHYPLIRVGKDASRYIARQVNTRAPFEQSFADHAWLIPYLGLTRYPIEVIPPSMTPAGRGPKDGS